MSGSLRIALTPAGPRIFRPADLPVARLLRGRDAAEVAEMLPRLFNLCGAAQGEAARLALGIETDDNPEDTTRREVLRDHLAKLFIAWPRLLGLAPQPLPQNWAEGGRRLSRAIWGHAEMPGDLRRWLGWDEGVAPVLSAIAETFSKGEAEAALPALSDPFTVAAEDNSPAARVADHPLMQEAEARFGRGPFWRALGRAVDLQAAIEDVFGAESPAPGRATAPAARGTYAIEVALQDGRLTDLTRITPTDHLLAPGGVLERSLATLPAAKARLAPLVVDILDPCVPWEVADA